MYGICKHKLCVLRQEASMLCLLLLCDWCHCCLCGVWGGQSTIVHAGTGTSRHCHASGKSLLSLLCCGENLVKGPGDTRYIDKHVVRIMTAGI